MSVWNCVVLVTCVRQCVMYLHEGVSFVTCVRQCVMYLHEGVSFVTCFRQCVMCLHESVCCCDLFQAMCDVSTWRCVIVTCVRQCVMYQHAGVLLLPVSGNVWCTYMQVCCYLCQAMCDVPTCRCVVVACVRQCVMYLHGGMCCCYLFQVICGQNCTFLVQANGSLLACGEGSYGRLGQGNSDDVHAPTIITSLQGNFFLMTGLTQV